MDTLEKFIAKNREAFDVVATPATAWGEILRGLEQKDGLEQFIADNKPNFDIATPSDKVGEQLWLALSNKKSDGLEQFLIENKNHLDIATPPKAVWNNIEQNLPKPQAKMLFLGEYSKVLLRIAAGLALLITCFGAGMWYANSTNGGGNEMAMSEVSNEYAEIEEFYQRDIAGKTQKLATFTSTNSHAIVSEDMVQMDKMMEELKKELANVPVNKREQIIRAMIENYKAKAKILEKVLENIQEQQISEPTKSNTHHGIKNI
jgi:hypothetical protein